MSTVRGFSPSLRFLLASTAVAAAYSQGAWGVLGNLYLLRLGHGPQFVGLANAVMMLGMAGASLPGGELGRRFTPRLSMVAGLALYACASVALGLAWLLPPQRIPGWVLVQFLLIGIGSAVVGVNSVPFIMSLTKSEESGQAFSVSNAMSTAVGFLGALLAGLLPSLFAAVLGTSLSQPGPYGLGLLLGAFLLAPAGLLLLPATEPKAGDRGQRQAIPAAEPAPISRPERERFPVRPFVRMSLVLFVFWVGMGTVAVFWNVYFDQALHLPTPLIGTVSAMSQLVAVPAALSAPLFAARLGRPRTYLLAALAGSASMAVMGLSPVWTLAAAGLFARVAFFNISSPIITVTHQSIVSPRWRGLMSGAANSAVYCGWAITAWGGGRLIAVAGYRSLFLGGAGLVALAALLFWIWFGRGARQAAPVM